MVDQFHKLKLSISSFGVSHILERSTELFYCDILLGHRVYRSTKTKQIYVLNLIYHISFVKAACNNLFKMIIVHEKCIKEINATKNETKYQFC